MATVSVKHAQSGIQRQAALPQGRLHKGIVLSVLRDMKVQVMEASVDAPHVLKGSTRWHPETQHVAYVCWAGMERL